MSGFKTPTAMSPPRSQAKSPLIRTASNMAPADWQNSGQQSSINPYGTMPGLMRAFEKLKSPSSAQAGTTIPQLPPITDPRVVTQSGGTGTNLTSSVSVPVRSISKEDNSLNLEALVGGSPGLSSPSLSNRRSSDSMEGDRHDSAPYGTSGMHQPGSPINNCTSALRSPFQAYGHISESVDLYFPYSQRLPQSHSSPELEVYRRHESNGRLMVCEAREEHCSRTVTSFVGERTGFNGMEDLKAELIRILDELGKGGRERAKADLKVVTGNMLERIVAWDLNRAEALEQPDILLLSTIPTAGSLNEVDAKYIIKMFRLGMYKISEDDIRSKVGRLRDQDLMALLHFTLLISRPVLAWELDLDEI